MTPHLLKPARFTPPLSEDFPSLWDRYERIIQVVWKVAFGYTLEPWQCWLLRSILELYPNGHTLAGKLRYRQVVISIPRQNGKTEIAAALGLIGLLREKSPLVIGIASNREQAQLVYKRALQAVLTNPSLHQLMNRATEGRGIQSNTGGLYEVKAAKGASLQGLPISTGIVDEVHIIKPDLWTALIKGMGGRHNTITVGITTAGAFSDSELLVNLYKNGEKAIEGDPEFEQFGFFCWEAPVESVPEDRDELVAALYASQPALASGRKDLKALLAEIAGTPAPDVLRYDLNRFTDSLNPYMPPGAWSAAERREDDGWPMNTGTTVYSISQSTDDTYASITAHIKTPDGKHHTELAATFVNPNPEILLRACERLWNNNPRMFAMDRIKLGPLANELKRRGYPVWFCSGADVINAASVLYLKVMNEELTHGGEPLINVQMARAKRKQVQGSSAYKIDPASSAMELDAVMATALGTYVAEQLQEVGIQLF